MTRYRPHPRLQSGFTLVELLVVLAILAIFATIALPSYQRLVADYRVTSQANSVQGLLQFARTEAIKRTSAVVICVIGDQFVVRVGDACGDGSIEDAANLRSLGLDASLEFRNFPQAGLVFAPSGAPSATGEFDVVHRTVSVDKRVIRIIASGFSEVGRVPV